MSRVTERDDADPEAVNVLMPLVATVVLSSIMALLVRLRVRDTRP